MRLVLSALALISIPAFADCPNVASTYKCVTNEGTTESHTVSQSKANGVTTYVVDKQITFSADGQNHAFTGGTALKNASYRASCDKDSTLNVYVTGQAYWGSAYQGDVTSTGTAKLEDGKLMIAVNDVFEPVDRSGERKAQMTLVCTPAQ